MVQGLQERVYDRRRDFCQDMSTNINENPGFLSNVLLSDECILPLDKSDIAHNTSTWSKSNPHPYVSA